MPACAPVLSPAEEPCVCADIGAADAFVVCAVEDAEALFGVGMLLVTDSSEVEEGWRDVEDCVDEDWIDDETVEEACAATTRKPGLEISDVSVS